MELTEIKAALEAGLKAQGEKLQGAIDKFHGQIEEKGKADSETRAEVTALAEKFRSIRDEITDLAQKMTSAKTEAPVLSAGEEFVRSEQYKQLVAGQVQRARIELKNTVTSTSSTALADQRPGMIPGSFVPLTVRDVLRSIPVTSNMVNSLRETAFTNSAAEVSQGAAKLESDITFAPYNVPIETVAHWIKISNQLLADAPAVVAYIETRLRDGLAQRIENQFINGNGTAPNLSGFTDSGNFTAYTPASGANLVDTINRAKYAMWATGNVPDTAIVNPATWATMERAREGTGTGTYLYGLPGMGAGMSPFGVRVVLSTYLAAAKIIMARFSDAAVVFNRSGAVVEMGYVNDDFTKNLVTVRAEERLGLACDRPAGIYYGDFTA